MRSNGLVGESCSMALTTSSAMVLAALDPPADRQ
jgi:hypothetical protein